jgi:Tfp pilus assembly protein PilO
VRFLAVLVALALPLVAYYPVYQDREATIRTLDKQIYELDIHIEQAKAAQRKLSQFHEEVQRLNEEVAKLRRILPPDPALNEIRDVVDQVAQASGVRIDRFQPRQALRKEYIEAPIDTSAEGTIDALASFFDALRNKARIINVSDVTLEKASTPRWRAKFVMAAFALPD